jgi:hypothetical protein
MNHACIEANEILADASPKIKNIFKNIFSFYLNSVLSQTIPIIAALEG